MATLADSFLQDLNDLEDDLESREEKIENGVSTLPNVSEISAAVMVDAERKKQVKQKAVAVISNLSSQPDFISTMEEVRKLTCVEPLLKVVKGGENDDTELHQDFEYQLVEKSNQLVTKLDVEILNIYGFVRDIYSKKFPELESIVFSPLEYIAAVKLIKNETDLTLIDLSSILPNTVTMAVTVASSMTTGQPLACNELEKVLEAAEEAMHLAECRKDVLIFLESRMGVLAPNVSAIVGAALAARLITHAGGLVSLARMPAQNIMLVGSTGTTAKAGGSAGGGIARGVIYSCDLIQSTPLAVRNRALKLVAGKVSLAARVDSFHETPTGDTGKSLREKIVQSLLKAQEPPPAPMKKALPIPDDGPKKRRGGKRHRRAKEKYGLSEFRKHANRLAFGTEAEEEVGQEMEGAGFGMIGKGFGHGKLRLQVKQQKMQVKQQRKQQRRAGATTVTSSSGTATATGTSSICFTPLQGIELSNPDAIVQAKIATMTGKTTEKDYFSTSTGFLK